MISQFRDIYHYREAVRNMVARDLKVRYSNSVLGIIWSLFSPLLMTLVYYVVFTYLVPSGIQKFPIYLMAGLMPWTTPSTTRKAMGAKARHCAMKTPVKP